MSESGERAGLRSGDRGPAPRTPEEIDAIVAVDREIRRLQGLQLKQLARFTANRTTRSADSDSYDEFATDELAVALTLPRGTAKRLLDLAVTVASRLPAAGAALAAGKVDLRRVQALADVVRPLPIDIARRVESYVMPHAETKNATELRRAANRAVIRFDPEGAEQRHQVRRLDRKVEFAPREDGMAELRAYLTAPDAVRIKLRLDAFAKAAPPDDERTLDQRRADAFRDLLLDRSAGSVKTVVHVTVPASVLASTASESGQRRPRQADGETAAGGSAGRGGAWAEPAELTGYGTITASQARDLAARDATWKRLLTDSESGTLLDFGRTTYAPPAALADFVRARDQYCIFPGCSRDAASCDLDHRVPFPKGSTSADNLAPLCRHHHRLKHEGKWRVFGRSDGHYAWISPAEIEYLNTPEPIAEPDPGPELPPNLRAWLYSEEEPPPF